MARAKDGKTKSKALNKAEESAKEPQKKVKAEYEAQSFQRHMFYKVGSISKNVVMTLKELMQAEAYEKAGEAIGSFQSDVESGWKYPDEVFAKNKIKIKGKPFGVIAGSFTRCGTSELVKAYKTTASFLGRTYRNGRVAILIKMWNAEHPGASETEKKKIAKEIEELFSK